MTFDGPSIPNYQIYWISVGLFEKTWDAWKMTILPHFASVSMLVLLTKGWIFSCFLFYAWYWSFCGVFSYEKKYYFAFGTK
jgi:hypothetical protein